MIGETVVAVVELVVAVKEAEMGEDVGGKGHGDEEGHEVVDHFKVAHVDHRVLVLTLRVRQGDVIEGLKDDVESEGQVDERKDGLVDGHHQHPLMTFPLVPP